MVERQSMEAKKAIERKKKKDQRDWDAALLVEERLLKQQEKQEKDQIKGDKKQAKQQEKEAK
jgi:hypothetical protein